MSFLYDMFVKVVSANFMFEVISGSQKAQDSVQASHLFLVLILGLAPNLDEFADHVDKIAEYHTAGDLHNRYEKPLDVI